MEYVGNELDLFANATTWKGYFGDQLRPFVRGTVGEVGAGIGGTTPYLHNAAVERWVCIEPDPRLAARLADRIARGELPPNCEVFCGTLAEYEGAGFDCILYVDVLEHIEDDRAEVARAAKHLRPGGHVIALSPAHQWLFTPFDRAIGHHRRYTRAGLGALAGPDLAPVRLCYLDSIGFFASLGNRLFLKSAMPKPAQVAFWDRVLVRMSRVVDPALGYSAGKSVLAVWRKTAA
jgi:SAM-dependent methyltransferase